MDGYEGRQASNSYLTHHQPPSIYHTNQDMSPLHHHRPCDEINSNQLLMSPTAFPFTEDDPRVFRMEKSIPIDRRSKDGAMPNSPLSLGHLHSATSPTNIHNHYFNESSYEPPPGVTMIDTVHSSSYYTTHDQPTQQHVMQQNVYDDQCDRNTVQHNFCESSSAENYNSIHQHHFPSAAPPSDVSSSLAEDSLSSSAVAVYQFNNTLIDFTNPSDIFQFDRVYSASSTTTESAADSAMCSYQQGQNHHHQHLSISPALHQGK